MKISTRHNFNSASKAASVVRSVKVLARLIVGAVLLAGPFSAYAQSNATTTVNVGDDLFDLATDTLTYLVQHGQVSGAYFTAPEFSHGRLKLNETGPGTAQGIEPDWAAFQAFGTFSNRFGIAVGTEPQTGVTRELGLLSWSVEVLPLSAKGNGSNFWGQIRKKFGGMKFVAYIGTRTDKPELFAGAGGTVAVGN